MVCCYSPDRRGEHPLAHLQNFSGVLQADSYAGFEALYDPERQPGLILEVACWAHARRKFFDIHVAHKSPIAAKALSRRTVAFNLVQLPKHNCLNKEKRGGNTNPSRCWRNCTTG
jgi:hypothetical protein